MQLLGYREMILRINPASCIKSGSNVKKIVKIGLEGHLEGHFGGTAKFLIYFKKW